MNQKTAFFERTGVIQKTSYNQSSYNHPKLHQKHYIVVKIQMTDNPAAPIPDLQTQLLQSIQETCLQLDSTKFQGMGTLGDYRQLIECARAARQQQEEKCNVWIGDMQAIKECVGVISDNLETIGNEISNPLKTEYTPLLVCMNDVMQKILHVSTSFKSVHESYQNINIASTTFHAIHEQVRMVKSKFRHISNIYQGSVGTVKKKTCKRTPPTKVRRRCHVNRHHMHSRGKKKNHNTYKPYKVCDDTRGSHQHKRRSTQLNRYRRHHIVRCKKKKKRASQLNRRPKHSTTYRKTICNVYKMYPCFVNTLYGKRKPADKKRRPRPLIRDHKRSTARCNYTIFNRMPYFKRW